MTDTPAINTLKQIVNDVRSDYNSHNSLGDSFADHCDAVSDLVLMVMENHGYEGAKLINGSYEHAYPDSEKELYGHVWIEWGELIIDATRCQFDNHEFIVKVSESPCYQRKD